MTEALKKAGYLQIGLDHFALPGDDMAAALRNGKLRRNFQGYTTDACDMLLGFGASAIGRLPHGYVQNEVNTRAYLVSIASGKLATVKGYALTEDDRLRAEIIERIMCDFGVDLDQICARHQSAPETMLKLVASLEKTDFRWCRPARRRLAQIGERLTVSRSQPGSRVRRAPRRIEATSQQGGVDCRRDPKTFLPTRGRYLMIQWKPPPTDRKFRSGSMCARAGAPIFAP